MSDHVTGWDVYKSEEFKALCKRFNIAYGLPTLDITIRLTEDHLIVTQTYQGRTGEPDQPAYIDTTTLHNDKWRTRKPREDHV